MPISAIRARSNRNGHEQGHLEVIWRELRSDVFVELGNIAFGGLNSLPLHAELDAMVLLDPALEGEDRVDALASHAPAGEIAISRGKAVSSMSACSVARPETPSTSVTHRARSRWW